MKLLLALTAALAGAAAVAQADVIRASYLCARGVVVPVTYVNAGDLSLAVLQVEGRQVALNIEVSASGARYGNPVADGSYVWWEAKGEATLFWKEGTDPTGADETPILTDCRAQTD